MMDIPEKKRLYREEFLAKRLRMSFEEVMERSAKIQERFLSLSEYRKAKRIALYASFKNEVLTDSIFTHALSHKKGVFFPKVSKRGEGLVFSRVRGKEDLTIGSYNILEPQGCDNEPLSSFDIVVVPGIAFDSYGNRIGYGKGYYDMTLANCKGKGFIVGLAYAMQVLDKIPHLSHDVRVDLIVTEEGVIKPVE